MVLSMLPLNAQAPLKALERGELELIRAGLPARVGLATMSLDGIQKEERLGDTYSFKARPPILDPFGQVHVRYDQFHQGVRVWDGMAIVHIGTDGVVLKPTLSLRRDLRQAVEPTISLYEAQATAVADLALKQAHPRPVTNELVLYPILGERISPVRSRPGQKTECRGPGTLRGLSHPRMAHPAPRPLHPGWIRLPGLHRGRCQWDYPQELE